MNKIILTIISISLIFSQDDFFDPGTTIAGYGELHYNMKQEGDADMSHALDFHRFIIYYGYNFTEKWSFKSEVELEHNFINDGEGELELEQAFVSYHIDRFGFSAGVVLPDVGIINRTHEPPTFLSVERPDYAKYIIPTTWFGNGFSFYGSLRDIHLSLVMLEDLEGEDIGAGIRGARGKGYEATAYSWTKNVSLSYTGLDGYNIGGSYTINDAPIDDDPDNSVSVSLMEFNLQYSGSNIRAVAEYGSISYDSNPSGVSGTSGYYFDFGYNLAPLFNMEGSIVPWARYSSINKDNDDTDNQYTKMTFGLCYKPIDQIALKLDYGVQTPENDDDATTLINVGVGYNF